MTPQAATIRRYFAKLGLVSEIADIYLALHRFGPQTMSELSRNAKVERTRLYRLIDQLMESNLIEIDAHHNRGILKPAPIANLRILIMTREQELKSLQDELELIEQSLARNSLSSPAATIQLYYGEVGLKQMLTNQLAARGKILKLTQHNRQLISDPDFVNQWVAIGNKNALAVHELCNENTNPKYQITNDLKNYKQALLPSALFTISHSVDVYNDTVCHFQWSDGDLYGMEIRNREQAQMQRQLFEMLWLNAMKKQP